MAPSAPGGKHHLRCVQLHRRLGEITGDGGGDDAQGFFDRFFDQQLLFAARAVQHEIGHRLVQVQGARVASTDAQFANMRQYIDDGFVKLRLEKIGRASCRERV